MSDENKSEFEKAAETESGGNIIGEFFAFLGQNKKWWLLPIIAVMLLIGALIVYAPAGATPFIYSLF